MTPTLRVVLIVVSILTTFMIMRKIRQSKLQIEDSIFWLGFSSILIVFSIFPGLPDLLAELAGTYTTANFIYLAVIFLLIVKMFHMSTNSRSWRRRSRIWRRRLRWMKMSGEKRHKHL